jgi:hypothetical protein
MAMGAARHKPSGCCRYKSCGSCRRLRRWRKRSFSCQRCVECTGLFATLVTSDCSYRDRVDGDGCRPAQTLLWLPGTSPMGAAGYKPCGSCRRLRRWRMRSFSRQRCVECTGLFATLVTSDCSYRDRVMRWMPPGTNPVGVARHKSSGSCPIQPCGSCPVLTLWELPEVTTVAIAVFQPAEVC